MRYLGRMAGRSLCICRKQRDMKGDPSDHGIIAMLDGIKVSREKGCEYAERETNKN